MRVDVIEPAPHEFTANFLFEEYGLVPFFAFDSVVKDFEGTRRVRTTAAGREWRVTLYYQESGLAHPGEMTPQGTEFALDTIREFRLSIEACDDPDGQRPMNAHVAPRWQGMESDTGRQIPVPDGFSEGINVRTSGSNIPFEDYHEILASAVDAVGVGRKYVEDPHAYSNVQDAAVYVRLHRDASGPVHARDGPLAELGHLLEGDRDGFRATYQQDRDGRGNQAPGYNHHTTLGSKRSMEAFGTRLPLELKHYLAREAESLDPDNPLHHPKVEAAYQVSRWDETIGIEPADIEQLREQLEEALLSVLADAGIDLSNSGPYVSDTYFEATEHDRGPSWEPVTLNLTQLRQEQESIVVRNLADGLSPVEFESLETLVTDGGELSPMDIATETERHPGSVRRALNRMDDLVIHEYGEVQLRSEHIAGLVHDAVQEARESVQRAVDTATTALEAAERGIGE
ncbi:MAG: MarR family transcriptional regulator, partial [Halobacteriaceae archaeon]